MSAARPSLNQMAVAATNHCLTGCAAGEVGGLVLATWWGWGTAASIGLAIGLAFVFAYGLTLRALARSGLSWLGRIRVAFAADTVSIVVMETVDNAIVLVVPGAMTAGLADPLFWGSLALSLVVAWAVAFPVNRWLLGRGLGHALVTGQHAAH